ncbi:DUF2784 domain-containing protein [Paucibacter sp. XJ19-41]|uniref:DUF2784 domain-containing protein n=1 Tax=Paucibacter sp. XJ19-41 TaxID=2927824 RepID=UPI0023498775|nr:DUF2784 domain-containing protein [Paucibacter sp. XJ19-41]MDC6170807.1 DUF2784 domain-containing protein [Paucibacter sp. XJ19-41]
MPTALAAPLADLVLILHLAVVLFVVFGLVAIVAGNVGRRRWPGVNRRGFRLAHLAAIGIVAAQAWLGQTCPLTLLENWLRRQAGQPAYGGQGFIADWLHRLLFYSAPDWVFALLYSGFGLLVLAAWCYFPPRPRNSGDRTP